MYMCQYAYLDIIDSSLQESYNTLKYLMINQYNYEKNEIPPPEHCVFYKLIPIEIECKPTICEKG